MHAPPPLRSINFCRQFHRQRWCLVLPTANQLCGAIPIRCRHDVLRLQLRGACDWANGVECFESPIAVCFFVALSVCVCVCVCVFVTRMYMHLRMYDWVVDVLVAAGRLDLIVHVCVSCVCMYAWRIAAIFSFHLPSQPTTEPGRNKRPVHTC
jgi:hypothetical protein